MLTTKEAHDLLEEVADQIRKANLGEIGGGQVTIEEFSQLVTLHNELYTAWQNAKASTPLGQTPLDLLAEDNAWSLHVAG